MATPIVRVRVRVRVRVSARVRARARVRVRVRARARARVGGRRPRLLWPCHGRTSAARSSASRPCPPG